MFITSCYIPDTAILFTRGQLAMQKERFGLSTPSRFDHQRIHFIIRENVLSAQFDKKEVIDDKVLLE